MRNLVAFLLFAVIFSFPLSAQWNVGYVSVEQAVLLHPLTKKHDQTLALKRQAVETKLLEQRSAIQTKLEAFQAAQASGTKSEFELKGMQDELMLMDQQLQASAQAEDKAFNEEAMKLQSEVLSDIEKKIDSIYKAEGLQCLLQNTDQQGITMVVVGPESASLQPQLMKACGVKLTNEDDLNHKFSVPGENYHLAYLSAEKILFSMPELTEMNQTLENLRQKIAQKLQVKQAYAQTKVEEYQQKQASGASESELQVMMEELVKLDQEVNQAAAEGDAQYAQTQEELLTPILDKMQAAVDKVAAAHNIDWVLNQSVGSGVSTILFGSEQADLTIEVAQELGVYIEVADSVAAIKPKDSPRVGYANIEIMMSKVPSMDQLNKEIESTEQMYAQQIQAMEKDLQAKFQAYYQAAQAGTMTAQQDLQTQQQLQKGEQDLQTLQSQAQQGIVELRGELLTPIIEKMQKAIEMVAEEKGYDLVLNQTSALNIVKYAQEDDLSQFILDKLNTL